MIIPLREMLKRLAVNISYLLLNNTPKCTGLKKIIFIISDSVGQELQCGLAGQFWHQVSLEVELRVSTVQAVL